MKKKIYESPNLTVTELETKDVIAVSGLIGNDTLKAGGELGYGMIEWDMEW